MLIDVKYAQNDIVRFRFGHMVKSNCDCTFCGSTGKVRGLDGTDEDCPRCGGNGLLEIRSYQETEEQNAIQKIRINWNRKSKPQVVYIMSGWQWSQTEIPQEDIIRKVGEYKEINGVLKRTEIRNEESGLEELCPEQNDL